MDFTSFGTIMILVAFVFWMFGQKYPSNNARKSYLNSFICKWYAGRQWECIEVIKDNCGPYRMPIRKIVLQNGVERIQLVRFCDDIVVGSKVELRIRTEAETSNGIFASAVDELMIPVLITSTKTTS
ncbi:MAG: hypothetical protein KGJ35_03235 [Patescibacteria group bacterium]|nr:hypothetical protein [Patescibacteria group bacterium]